jgi:hypothetical protein
MHHAGVMHLSTALALRNFLPQIRQPHFRAIAINQSLLSILAQTFDGPDLYGASNFFETIPSRPSLQTALKGCVGPWGNIVLR